jgi:signal transduction histidine kinase/CheY-like chemotaxis protein
MAENPQRTSRALVGLQSWHLQKLVLRAIAVLLAALAFFAISKFVLHVAVSAGQMALFAALVGGIVFVLDRLRQESTSRVSPLMESEKLHSQKMEAIGRLAGGVAHDFNNLLAVIAGYTDLMLESLGPSDANRPKLEQIQHAATSAASLTRQLLMFSRQQVIQPVVLDVNQIVSNTEKMLRRLIKENIEFAVVLEPNLDRVSADPGQIEQVILNLVVNARDAMPKGGKLRIQTSNIQLEKDSGAAEATGTLTGRHVLLEVCDTGTGMDRETQAHIFEPFFTTKEVGKGTGLGLATVYGIVQQSNGKIEVHSAVGNGSSFRIYLPAVKQAQVEHDSGREAGTPAFSEETVLVVEDAEPLRDLIKEGLGRFGCKVVTARNVEEALRIVKEPQTRIDLLLTDVVMPGRDGTVLAKEMLALRSETKILYMTGHSGEFVRADMLNPSVSLIRKPFTPTELARKIRKMLPVGTPAHSKAKAARNSH